MGKDLRFAWKIFRRSPGFAAIAVFSLALGIGATAPDTRFGIRLALGDAPSTLLRFSQFFCITAHDPLVIAAAIVLVAVVASLAGLAPARLPIRIDAVTALMHE